MSVSRQPAGTSVGGQWAPGAASEVEDSLDADFLVRDHGVVDDLLDESTDSDALGIISGARPNARGVDLSGAKGQLHGYLDHTSEGPGRDEAEAALTKLYAAEHPNPTIGIGRLVGDSSACRAAEAELLVQQETSRAQNMLAVSTSRMSEDYADLSGVVIDAEDPDDIIVTGEYVGSDGSASGYLNSADMTSLYRAYGADTHRRLTPQAATADLYTHQGGQRYALDVGRSSMAYSSIGGFRHQDADAVGDEAIAARAFAIRHDGGDRRTALYVDPDRPQFVAEKRMSS